MIGADVTHEGGFKNAYRTGSLIRKYLYQEHLVSIIDIIDIQALIKTQTYITDFQTRKLPPRTGLYLTDAECFAVDY